MKRTKKDFYQESKRFRKEVLQQAEVLKKGNKHEESAYFAYFDRKIGVRTILSMRKMKNGGPYKPYAIIDQYAFEANITELQKGTPL